MGNLIDSPEYTANEIIALQMTDPVEGQGAGAAYGGIGNSNEQAQQLANRTAYLYQRQNTNIANIGVLQAFVAGFVSNLQTNGYLKIPAGDVNLGAVVAIIQWGYYPLSQAKLSQDAQYSVTFPIPFPSAILLPPLATNYYFKTGGMNTVASVVSYAKNGATFVLDVPGDLFGVNGATAEITSGFSWLAIGY